jgi:hypothetical protein
MHAGKVSKQKLCAVIAALLALVVVLPSLKKRGPIRAGASFDEAAAHFAAKAESQDPWFTKSKYLPFKNVHIAVGHDHFDLDVTYYMPGRIRLMTSFTHVESNAEGKIHIVTRSNDWF